MQRRLPSLSALRVFEAAARLQSFKQAADELAVTATAVSHQIRALEADLACRLFLRKTRAVELTAEGNSLYAAVRVGFDAIATGVERLRLQSRPIVTLSTTPAFAAKWLVPRLATFQIEHPQIDLHVHASNQPVNLRSGAADLAVRYGRGPYADTIATLLLQDRFAPVASPRLRIRRPQDILRHPLIHFDWHRPPAAALTWEGWARVAGITNLDTTAGIRYSEESHAIQAALAGQGVALLSLELVQEEMRMGLLESSIGPVVEGLAYHVLRPAQGAIPEAASIVEAWLLRMASTDHVAELHAPGRKVRRKPR
jgi:LysR family transcriptional regulator, glycine cleavage system transcriptional activator